MNTEDVAASLSGIEVSVLKVLKDGTERNEHQIAEDGKINLDSVRRATAWLGEKKLLDVSEMKEVIFNLSDEGKKVVDSGLPEQRMLKVLSGKGKLNFKEALKKSNLDGREFNVALGLNKKNAFIIVSKSGNETFIELTEVAKEFMQNGTDSEKFLREIKSESKTKSALSEKETEVAAELLKRGLVIEKTQTERTAKINSNGKDALDFASKNKSRSFNIEGKVPVFNIGKKHPYIQFLLQIRRKLTELGFKEMSVPLVVTEFYNFDVLFQPQNHPARTWSDTYQLKYPKTGKLPDKKIVNAIKQAHETGGRTGSKGWGYDWSESVASRLMPNAHGTSGSARQIVEGVEIPGKYFAISRCYRPDVVDATHLNEFNQMEGFIVDESFTFKNLLGMLKQFAIEIAGAEKVKFYPDYYPFTEPSVQLSAKHPDLGWIEFGGAGIFRPEMTENLGVKAPILAWGLGIDRLAMFKLGINDIRYLFSQDLEWLRRSKVVRVE
ncbi:MAG: phenylalanine--tRNA ligase subunit alpha [Candidatus Diapherotrites archaeon]